MFIGTVINFKPGIPLNKIIKNRVSQLLASGMPRVLQGRRVGLEKESLRVAGDGGIAQTPHPSGLGSALTHPSITTDYSEALLELVTPPFEHFDETLATLQRLRAVDPTDTTGVKYLWQLGWGEYDRRNYSGAIGYWSELMGLYPESKKARSGQYWSARSHEALGNPDRARSILEDVASIAVTDFYRKHALARLGRAPGPIAVDRPVEATWPADPLLSRAELLSDLGIDQLGMEELETLEEQVELRAAQALRSRILARQGYRRESIQNLWRVFPMLGTSEQTVVPLEALRMYYPLDFLTEIERSAADNELPVTVLLASSICRLPGP